MVLNWLCYARAIGFKNYIFVTSDEYLLWWFRYKAGEGAVYLQMPEGEMQSSQQRKVVVRPPRFVYNDKNFKKFMLDRTQFVLNLLNRGWDVLIADVDQVWLDDPRDSLFDPARKEGYDIVAQDDVTMLCGGFMLLRSNGTFFDERLTCILEAVKKLWNDVFVKFRDDGAKTNEQLILKRFLEDGAYNVKAKRLPQDVFVSGKRFFEKAMYKDIGNLGTKPIPMVIHNNFVRTKEEKLARFRALGMWRVDNVDLGTCKQTPLPQYEVDVKPLIGAKWVWKIFASTSKVAQIVVNQLAGQDVTIILPKQQVADVEGAEVLTGKLDSLQIWSAPVDQVAIFVNADAVETLPTLTSLKHVLDMATKPKDWNAYIYGFSTLAHPQLTPKDSMYLYQRPNPHVQVIYPWFWRQFSGQKMTSWLADFTLWVERQGYVNLESIGGKSIPWSKLKVFDGNGAQARSSASLSLRSFAFGLDPTVSFAKKDTPMPSVPVDLKDETDGRGPEFEEEAKERDGAVDVE